MVTSRLPKKERRFLKEISCRLGGWSRRDFLGELSAAVSEYKKVVEDLDSRSVLCEGSLRKLDKAGQKYRGVFGDFCGLFSAMMPKRLMSLEEDFLNLAAEKEEVENQSLTLSQSSKSNWRGISNQSQLILEKIRAENVGLTAVAGHHRKKFLCSVEKINQLEQMYSREFDKEKKLLVFRSEKELEGLPKKRLQSARKLAASLDCKGWAIPLEGTVRQEVTGCLESTRARSRIQLSAAQRGRKVRKIAKSLAGLRHSAARLAGCQGWTQLRMRPTPYLTTAGCWDMLRQLTSHAAPLADNDVKLAQSRGWRSEKHGQSGVWSFIPSGSQDKPVYSPVQSLEGGCFYAARRLFGLRFQRVRGVKLYKKDVALYRATSGTGRCIGYLAADLFYRQGKESGAWTSCWEESSRYGGLPFVGIFCNLDESGCSLSGVEDIFHEFGHAVHALLTGSLPSFLTALHMTNDIAEVPSLLAESWILSPSVYSKIRTPQSPSMPPQWGSKTRPGVGLEYMGDILSAAIDLVWHDGENSSRMSPSAVRRRALENLGLPASSPYPPTYSPDCFSHIFCDGYDGSYFSYLSAEMQAARLSRWLMPRGDLSVSRGRRLASLLKKGGLIRSGKFTTALGLSEKFLPPDRHAKS